MIPPTTVVVGGGLAGITTALRLAEGGHAVTVLEARPRLGGATYSFRRGAMHVDTGQHVILRCYTHYRSLLKRLGVAAGVTIQPRLDIPVFGDGMSARLRRGRSGPPPLHLLGALAGYRLLSWTDRVSTALAAVRLRSIDPADPRADAETFAHWLRAHGQSQQSITRLWGLLTVAALNIDPAEASLALAARVFRTGLLDDVRAGDLGVLQSPLETLHDSPARNAFDRLGVRLHTRDRARAVTCRDVGFTVRTGDGELDADAVVMAIPHGAATGLVPVSAAHDAGDWAALGDSPIVNVHLVYDRRVMDTRLAALTDSDAGWVFDRTEPSGCPYGQYVVCSLSAADAHIDTPARQIIQAAHRRLARVFPRAASASLLDSFVTRERRATFRQRAGTAAVRPGAATDRKSLVLAGAWTATGLPDTMEGAVVSGQIAADALLTRGPGHRDRNGARFAGSARRWEMST